MAKTNLAYDFDRLERHYAAVGTPKVKQPPELKVVENRKKDSNPFMIKTAVVFIMVMGIVAAILYNNMVLTELTSEIENTETRYEQLKNEYRLMQMEIESKTSLRTVEEIAKNELGMSKVESYQVQYIDLSEGDRVVMARAPKLTLSEKIYKSYRRILEYMGL